VLLVGPRAGFSRRILEELAEVLLDGIDRSEARDDAFVGGVGLYGGRIEEQLFAPHEAGIHAHLDYPLEEGPEDLEPVAFADPGEGRVIGQGFVQVVAEVPANAEAVGHDPHELPLAAQILAEKTIWSLKKTTGSTDGLPPLA
jgi:hypothetical protein